MEIEQYLYDLNDSGDAIVAYTLSSPSGGSVQICNMGASVLSLTLPNEDGELREVAEGRCVRALYDISGRGAADRFDEQLWESRVEVNRVVMSLTQECDGATINIETVFDFDDDNNFEITYLACADGDVKFDLCHALKFDFGGDMVSSATEGVSSVEGAQRGILNRVATIECEATKRHMTILSSQPQIIYEGGMLAPIGGDDLTLKGGDRYIQKCVYASKWE